MLTEKNRLNLNQLIVIIISWMIFISMIFFYEYISIKIRFPDYYSSLNIMMDYSIMMIATFMAGIMGGSLLVFTMRRRFANQPFYYGIIYSAILFFLIYILITTFTSFIVYSINLHTNPFNEEVVKNVINNIVAPHQLRNILLWLFIIVSTQFFVQVNDKFGPGNMWKLIKGTYYNPKEELRVFMFLDIKSSTSIAEKLGHQKYYHFLNDFFAEITDPILNRQGEIYQYVGDEIVVSWPLIKAVKNLNCLYCFFEIKDVINKREIYFVEKYGIKPIFKAGIHFGPVTVGEVGIIKRDIIFTGDVLNTTSRIQSSCNDMGVDFLISENVLSLFDKIEPFQLNQLGEIALKGKQNVVKIASLQLLPDSV